MNNQLAGKVAIVTGGASGIGRASVLRFLSAGAKVVVADINERTGAETAELARNAGHGDRVRFFCCDVAQETQIESLVAFAVTEFGRLDHMFNNAGLVGAIGAITEVEVGDWDATFAVMVRGVFLGTKHATRAILTHGEGGAIINTASIAAYSAGAGAMAYSACKAAVLSITRSAAIELAQERIRVNAICPGLTLTPLIERGREVDTAAVLDKAQPWPELCQPDHVAEIAIFLASDQSRFVTGQPIVVDGGTTALGPGLYAGGNVAGNAVMEQFMQTVGHLDQFREEGKVPPLFDSGNID